MGTMEDRMGSEGGGIFLKIERFSLWFITLEREMEEGPELYALYQAVYDRVAPFVAKIEGMLHIDNSNINAAYRKGKMMLQQLESIRKGLDVLLSGNAVIAYVQEDNAYVRRTLLQIRKGFEGLEGLVGG